MQVSSKKDIGLRGNGVGSRASGSQVSRQYALSSLGVETFSSLVSDEILSARSVELRRQQSRAGKFTLATRESSGISSGRRKE